MSRQQVLGYRGTQVLDYVRQTVAREGRPPSYSMIMAACRFYDEAGVCRVIARLERRRLVERSGYGRQRRLKLVE